MATAFLWGTGKRRQLDLLPVVLPMLLGLCLQVVVSLGGFALVSSHL